MGWMRLMFLLDIAKGQDWYLNLWRLVRTASILLLVLVLLFISLVIVVTSTLLLPSLVVLWIVMIGHRIIICILFYLIWLCT